MQPLMDETQHKNVSAHRLCRDAEGGTGRIESMPFAVHHFVLLHPNRGARQRCSLTFLVPHLKPTQCLVQLHTQHLIQGC